MTPLTATLNPTPAQQGAPQEAPMQSLTIPGRPKSRLRDGAGRLLHDAHEYLTRVTHAARTHLGRPDGPAHPAGSIRLHIDLYYAFTPEQVAILDENRATWHLHQIPNADTAPGLILQALTGVLYTHTSQVDRLTVTRHVITDREAIARFGRRARRGAAQITWKA